MAEDLGLVGRQEVVDHLAEVLGERLVPARQTRRAVGPEDQFLDVRPGNHLRMPRLQVGGDVGKIRAVAGNVTAPGHHLENVALFGEIRHEEGDPFAGPARAQVRLVQPVRAVGNPDPQDLAPDGRVAGELKAHLPEAVAHPGVAGVLVAAMLTLIGLVFHHHQGGERPEACEGLEKIAFAFPHPLGAGVKQLDEIEADVPGQGFRQGGLAHARRPHHGDAPGHQFVVPGVNGLDNLGEIPLDGFQPADFLQAEPGFDDFDEPHQLLAQQVLLLLAHHLHGERGAPGLLQEGAHHLEAQARGQIGQPLGRKLQLAGAGGEQVFDKVEPGGLIRRRHFDDLGPMAAQEQVGVQLRQVAGGQDNHVAGLHQLPLPGPAQQGNQGRPVRLAHGPQVHRRHDGFGVLQDQGQGLGQAGLAARGGHDPLRQLQDFPGALGQRFGLGLLPKARKARARTRETSSPSSSPGASPWVGGSRACRKAFSADGIPELQPQAEIVEDHLAGLGQPMAQKMAERQVIAIHPGIIEDLPMQDKEG